MFGLNTMLTRCRRRTRRERGVPHPTPDRSVGSITPAEQRAGSVQRFRYPDELIKDAFGCKARGLIDVKGAGPREVW